MAYIPGKSWSAALFAADISLRDERGSNTLRPDDNSTALFQFYRVVFSPPVFLVSNSSSPNQQFSQDLPQGILGVFSDFEEPNTGVIVALIDIID